MYQSVRIKRDGPNGIMVIEFSMSHDLRYHPLCWLTTRDSYTFPEKVIIFKGELQCLIPVWNLTNFLSYVLLAKILNLSLQIFVWVPCNTHSQLSVILISTCNIVAQYCILRHVYIFQSIMNTLFVMISLIFFHPMPYNCCLVYILFCFIKHMYIYIKC